MSTYEIIFLTPATNQEAAKLETARYAVSLSGGLGSALAGERAIQRFGREQVLFWFADVLVEDEDLYRFLRDLMRRWGGKLYWWSLGKTPKQVWEKHGIIANNRVCPCSYELKVRPFREFIKSMPVLPQALIGYKAEEQTRQARTCASYAKAIPECRVQYPLTWEPVEDRDLVQVCRQELGIEPPRLYEMGFDYNNCGGGCCRSGIGGRVLQAIRFPDRFQADMEWEEMMRNRGGSLAGRAFCARVINGEKVPISLREIRETYVPLARAYLQAHPETPVSEKTLIKEIQKWQRSQPLVGKSKFM
jgi:hypothetical protein